MVPVFPSPHLFGVECQALSAAHKGPQLDCRDAGGRRAEPVLSPHWSPYWTVGMRRGRCAVWCRCSPHIGLAWNARR